MRPTPLQTLVSRHICTCPRKPTSLLGPSSSRSFTSNALRRRNVPSSTIPLVGQAEDLRRRYQPKPSEVNRDKIEYAKIKSRNQKAMAGVFVTALATFATVYFWPTETRLVKNDGPVPVLPLAGGMETPATATVEQVETGTSSVPTFPKTLYLSELDAGSSTTAIVGTGQQEYCLVGLGIRTVSFLGIQVYVVGMYVALPDIDKLQERLIRTQDPVATTLVPGEKGALREALMDGDRSEDIWNAVLQDGGIRSVFRIVPTRNTDFSHLKDGFVRQVTNKTQHFAARRNDQSFGDESFGQSMDDFKSIFKAAPKNQLPKGEILLLTRDAKGKLGAWYEDPKGVRTRFGPIIADERLSRLVWLQYLSGSSPSSPGARKSIVDGVMEYVERPVGTVSTQVV